MAFSRSQKAKRASAVKNKGFNFKNIDKNSKSTGKKHTKIFKTSSFVKDFEENSNVFDFFVNQIEFSAQIIKINLNYF